MNKEVLFWTLRELVNFQESELKRLERRLEEYRDNYTIEDFLRKRKFNVEKFKKLVRDMDKDMEVCDVKNILKSRGEDAKYYGGMTLRVERYFKAPKYIEELILKIDSEREREKEDPHMYNSIDYCIPDELDQITLEELIERESRS